jgi:hypothetical protein
MSAPDYPPGEWSPLLVGAHWVSGRNVTIVANSIANRRAVVSNFSDLYEMAQTALNTTLARQEGATAEFIRGNFQQGADEAFQVAVTNEAYAKAQQHSHNSVVVLRQLLTGIAEKGNREINDVLNSNTDFEAKVATISEVIAECQREANQRAAGCANDIMEAGQNVFAAQGIDQSFRGSAHGNGIGNVNRQPDRKAIEDQVRGKLNQYASQSPIGDNPLAPTGSDDVAAVAPGSSMADGAADAIAPASALTAPAPAASRSMASGAADAVAPAPVPTVPAPAASRSMASGAADAVAPAPVSAAAPGGGSPNLSAPGLSGSPQVPTSSMPSPLSAPSTGMPPGLAAANPTGMAPGVNTGAPASAPTTSGAADLPAGPVQAMDSQLQQAAEAAPTLPSAGEGALAAAQDMPSSVPHAPAPHAPPSLAAYTPEPISPMMTGPAAGAASAAAAGGLPAYGADLRPPVAASAPAAPVSQPPPPLSTLSGSAPINPAASQVGAGQPVVASQPGAAMPAAAQPGIGPQVVMATANGAMAGAMSADATARARLQRLLAAMARQQPLLAWAVGDRADGTTVLVTDLASGWIPSGVDVPTAVTLLEPARRRGNLDVLLGAVNPAATYKPGHYLPDPDGGEPVATSPRARHAPDVEELSWQLSDATHWRDGLPRLAHTLAKAASRGTGVLDSEAEQLHSELTRLADRVLDSYPDAVDAAEVGNWQLLAAIDALVTDDWIAANYHLAWFLACNTVEAQDVVR